jgi:subtilisin family serine protease
VSDLAAIVGDDVRLVPLFGNEERVIARAASGAAETGRGGPDLSVFYKVEAPAAQLQALANRLARLNSVEAAYVKPPAEPPMINEDTPPDPNDAPPVTPNFAASQIYLGAAPAGIEALWAHTQQGGKGNGIRIIDIEGAWRFDHEDLTQVQGGVVGGTQSADIGWRNHGTAVIGVFGGDENGIGVTGISPASNTRAISIFGAGQGSAKAIRDAADLLNAGEIILIELHRPGPRHNFEQRNDQLGYIAVEWWEDDWAAIRYATNKGVIVVEAAGNGAENLDDPIYSVRPAGFPAAWTNPFNRANRDSAAIVVGAGAPPPGTHGRDHGPDRSRLGFSNYGALVDVQGWGREVTTTGYGVLQGGGDERLWYTDQFSGTSSSSPVVVGSVACVQGNRLARGLALYTPAQMRNRLRTTGSPQTDAPGRPATQRIGNRPNLKSLIGLVKITKELVKEVKAEKIETKEVLKEKPEKTEIKEGKELKEKIETKEVVKEKPEVKEQIEKQIEKRIEKQIEKQLEKRIEKQLEKQLEKGREVVGGFGTGAPLEALEARLGALEAAVIQISHFISGELRPDLSRGALTGEQDLAGTQQQLDAAGKAAKDSKDLEKLDER